MHARDEARRIPEGSHRYWCHTLGERGEHHFRFPTYDVASAVNIACLPAYRDIEPNTDLPLGKYMELVPYMSALIGACWWHRAFDLDVVLPDRVTTDNVLAYGRAVADELQDHDYTLFDIMELFGSVSPELGKRLSALEMAKARADFSTPPRDDAPPSPQKSDSSTSGEQSASTT